MNPLVQVQEDDDSAGYTMPCAEAMLAGTLALMTGYAENRCPQHRMLMAQKVVSNLFFLASHPSLSENFRMVAGRMHRHWMNLVTPTDPAEPPVRAWAQATGAWH
ncbi:hypothetical protein [Tepidicella baoligensis]|uniref:hypothetical protein n=1 Tax=Tepidicella baoligensis TaxID=2707016 RepID=UPI0015DBBBCF|nr:hypothetical protein [Tepidicella baoligensis]